MTLALSFASHSDLDNRHVLLPNDHPIHPCWVPMEPSSPSQLDLERNLPPPGVAIFLQGCVLCRPLEPLVVHPQSQGRVASRLWSPLPLHPYTEKVPTALPRSSISWIHVVYSDCVSHCFARLRFQLRLSSRAPQCSTKQARSTRLRFRGTYSITCPHHFWVLSLRFVYQVSNLI